METEELRGGGLIDIYWISTRIIFPLLLILLLAVFTLIIGYSCPYMEDVSSCFPYNLPDWAKILLPFALIIIPTIAIILMVQKEKKE